MAGRLSQAWSYIRKFEPARLRAAWIGLGIVLTSVGLTIPYDIDARVQWFITGAGLLLTYGQAESTRAAVVPYAAYEQAMRALPPDTPTHYAAN